MIISNCYSTGEISGQLAGGICGDWVFNSSNGGRLKIENCYSTGIISGNSAGGIIGGSYNGGRLKIENCYSTGIISGDGSAGGIIGSSSNTNTIVKNCYTIGTFSNNNGIFGENLGSSTEINCLATNNNSWSDISATSTILVEKPNTWLIFKNNTPWLLLSFNAQIYDPNIVYSSSNPYISSAGLFTNSVEPLINYTYSIITVNNSYIIPSEITINKSNGKITFDNIPAYEYKVQVLVGDKKTNSGIYQNYQINNFTFIYDSYDIYNIQFSELEILQGSANFTYNGSTDNNKKYVAGMCTFLLVNQLNEPEEKNIWQWEVEIIQNNKKATLTGTVITNAGIILTPEYLWNIILSDQQKTSCILTLDKDDPITNRSNLNSYLYAVGKTDEFQISKLYLFITINPV